MTAARFTTQQKYDAVERELRFRHRVFERRVAEGKMTRDKAQYEIDVMSVIAEDYRKQLEEERLI